MDLLWDERGLYALQGPKAVDVLQRMAPSVDLSKVSFGELLWVSLKGTECLLMRCGYTGEDGFEIFVPAEGAVGLWEALKSESEVRLAALGARDSLRMEAGLCLYGHELDENITPPEAGLTWVVAKARRDPASKNPFLGSERILSEIKDKSYKRLRAGLMPKEGVKPGPPARDGAAVETLDGESVGIVTSGTQSPCLKKNIAIAYINKPFNKQGTDLNLVVRNKKYPFTVVKMPFVPTQYYKA
jgi:aminomethyltransferase